MTELPFELTSRVAALTGAGNYHSMMGTYQLAAAAYEEALALLPIPRRAWPMTGRLLASLGDVLYQLGRHEDAASRLNEALDAGMEDNPFVHLRLGQSLVEAGDYVEAADSLARAFAGGGAEIFSGEPTRYFEFLQAQLLTPRISWHH